MCMKKQRYITMSHRKITLELLFVIKNLILTQALHTVIYERFVVLVKSERVFNTYLIYHNYKVVIINYTNFSLRTFFSNAFI